MTDSAPDHRPPYSCVLYQYADDNLWDAWNPEHGIFQPDIYRVPPDILWLFSADMARSEIQNGGFHQLFINPGGVLVPEAIHGHRLPGFDAAANVISTAMTWFGKDYPRQQQIRNDLLRRHQRNESQFDRQVDDPFYELDDAYSRVLSEDSFVKAADSFVARFQDTDGK